MINTFRKLFCCCFFLLTCRKQAFEEKYLELNSRIISSLIYPPADSQTLEVRVTFQHLKVRLLLYRGLTPRFLAAVFESGLLFFMPTSFVDHHSKWNKDLGLIHWQVLHFFLFFLMEIDVISSLVYLLINDDLIFILFFTAQIECLSYTSLCVVGLRCCVSTKSDLGCRAKMFWC